jgi:serine/threonine protein kinase
MTDTTAVESTPPDLRQGAVIGRYTILESLGAGGMATVYSAYDAQLGRIVAMKVLRPHVDVAEIRGRLLREAQAMARLKHPNVITVYDVGTFGDRIFIAMEYVDGTTLKRWLQQSARGGTRWPR